MYSILVKQEYISSFQDPRKRGPGVRVPRRGPRDHQAAAEAEEGPDQLQASQKSLGPVCAKQGINKVKQKSQRSADEPDQYGDF